MLSSDFGATFLRERLTGPSLKASFFFSGPRSNLFVGRFFAQKTWSPNPCFCIFPPKIYGFYGTQRKPYPICPLRQGPHQPWWKAQENTTKAGTRSLDNDGNLPRAETLGESWELISTCVKQQRYSVEKVQTRHLQLVPLKWKQVA